MRASARPLLRLRARAALYRFRESLFVLPALIVLTGVGLAELAAAADRAAADDGGLPFTLSMSSNTAATLLSTVAGATITTAGVVFSLTVVSLQLASSQFSPRVMRSFIRDRLSQLVIGSLIATFVFAVVTLTNVDGGSTAPAPRISLTVAVVLTVITVLLIVAHLDHLAQRLQVGEVARRISEEGCGVIAAAVATARAEEATRAQVPPEDGPVLTVPALRDGWVTQAAGNHMLAAVPPHSTVRMETRTGAYIHEGEPLLTVWPVPVDADTVTRHLQATVLVADTRTMQEDVDFGIRQLVDIALRALSASINDPTTAVEVTLRLGSLLRRLLVHEPPAEAVAGPEGRVLLRPWQLSPDEYVAHAFDQLRQEAPSQPEVAAALLRVLHMLLDHVRDADRPDLTPALEHQIRLLTDALRETRELHPDDLARLEAIARGTDDPADHSHRWERMDEGR